MIYDANSELFKSFLSSGKHKPTTDEILEALEVIKQDNPKQTPEVMAAMLRGKYPQWILDDVDWVELSRRMDDD